MVQVVQGRRRRNERSAATPRPPSCASSTSNGRPRPRISSSRLRVAKLALQHPLAPRKRRAGSPLAA